MNWIKKGDEVVVSFHNAKLTLCRGIVKNVPCMTGDSWIIEDDDKNIIYISEGCTVTKMAVDPFGDDIGKEIVE